VVWPLESKKLVLGVKECKNSYKEVLSGSRKANHDFSRVLVWYVCNGEGIGEDSPKFHAEGECAKANVAAMGRGSRVT
jgi:hypothetical protein